ncbi:uncharacterized protein F5891DRAFT_982584 [Suillus fuscotomentosus]|uniref:Uncharacterized protein n=1 Tax=Suillus fuscotomentosus TaxID=1912939 RepID=A0AAD4E3I9_9AGAM|nr:uncharacterized protein F5891DRAFT_982584 [Suillus fuscotomentosus]KAG1897618.1 hypothetical protein F5891DRAFT_982584 [Suillus fuscotomentosus]
MYPRLSAHPVKFAANGIARPPPPSRPFKVVARPITNQQTPPPARPFQAAVKSAVPMASKAAMQEVIELTSASEGSKDATAEEPDTEYEDDLRGNKRKLKSGNSSRTSKKRASSEAIIEPKKEGVRFKAKPLKPSPSDASPLKGGPLSPLTVGSSSVDEERSSGNEAAQPVRPAIRIRDGTSKVQPKFKALPKPKHVAKESRTAMHRVHRRMYTVDSEEEDAPGRIDSEVTADAGKGATTLADPQLDAAAQPVNPTPITLASTTEDNVSGQPEVTPSVASQPQSSEPPQPSNSTIQTTSSPFTPSNEENGNSQARSINHPSSRPAGQMPLPQPEPLQTDIHIEGAEHYACSPLFSREAPIPREASLHMHELPSHPREPSVPLREPLLRPREPSVPLREPLLHPREPSVPLREPLPHPREPSVPLRDRSVHPRDHSVRPREGPSYSHDDAHYRDAHDTLYDRNGPPRTHPHPSGILNPHGLPRTRNIEEARYGRAPMGFNHPGYPSRYGLPAEGYDDRYDDPRYPSDSYYQDMRSHDRRYYGDNNRWADRR